MVKEEVEKRKELKRYYATVEFVTKNGKAYLTLFDSHDLNVKYTAISTVKILEDNNLRVYVGKNFHFVIYDDGSYSIYWIKSNSLAFEEEVLREEAFKDLFEIHYLQRP